MWISNRVALVTGASSGIGWASAIRLADAGARLIVHGRDRARLSALANRTGGVALAGDLADPREVDRLAEEVVRRFGRIDIVVHNAGVGWAGQLVEMGSPDIARLVAVNLVAPIRLTQAVLPVMQAQRSGYLIFVTSIAGRLGVAGEAVYASTKAGLDCFAECLRLELRGSRVGVGVLVPGVVETAFFERRGRPYQRSRPLPVPPGRVADVLVRMIAVDGPERYTPNWLRLPVAIRVAAPGLYRRLAGRFGGS